MRFVWIPTVTNIMIEILDFCKKWLPERTFAVLPKKIPRNQKLVNPYSPNVTFHNIGRIWVKMEQLRSDQNDITIT